MHIGEMNQRGLINSRRDVKFSVQFMVLMYEKEQWLASAGVFTGSGLIAFVKKIAITDCCVCFMM